MRGAVRLGVVLMCHDEPGLAARMARIWIAGGARVAIHADTRMTDADLARLRAGLPGGGDVILTPRRRCSWGSFTLVRATQDAATALLERFSDTTHVFLASGACLPLRPVADLLAHLAADPGCDHIESTSIRDTPWTVGGLGEERLTLFFPFDFRRQRPLFDRFTALQRRWGVRRRVPAGLVPHFGSQWWCLTAQTLRSILDDPRRAEFDRFFRHSWIPDESYFQTLVRRHSIRIESWSLTLSRFDHDGRPHLFYDDHIPLLAGSRCFVARKIWPGAARLLAHFPAQDDGQARADPPQPGRAMQAIAHAARRRTRGRPGLYMQSRFPRAEYENGKTAAPYAVLAGPGDMFPGLESWLGAHLDCDVHGHLFAPEGAEFAHRPPVGPGALSPSARVRDHDPRGWLAALIRITDRMQVFQFGPRDSQALIWFMASDPNARLLVVPGAWALPLSQAAMPLARQRRAFADLQRTEAGFLRALDSPSARARVIRHDLGDVLARPAAILDDFLRSIDANWDGGTALPPLRNPAGLDGFLRRMRNAGVPARLPGLETGIGAGIAGTDDPSRVVRPAAE